jgi:hypothetical protein
MKKLFAVFLLLFVFAGCSAKHMLVVDKKSDIKSGKDATLVIVGDKFFGPAETIRNYLDNKLIGEIKSKTYFVTKVSPGQHYVVAAVGNVTVYQMNFKAGKVYFLRQDVWPGFWKANAGYSAMTKDEALKAIKECEYREYDKNNPGEDIDPATYAKGINDYNLDVKKRPDEYKPFIEYQGYDL